MLNELEESWAHQDRSSRGQTIEVSRCTQEGPVRKAPAPITGSAHWPFAHLSRAPCPA